MALAPQFIGHRIGAATAPHTLEVYLDYVCPFSAKIYRKLREIILPYIEQHYPGQVQFIFRQQVQPWHPTSTMVHEAAIAVEAIDASKFMPFSDALFEKQKDYFDEFVYNKSRHAIYGQLADLVQASVGISGEKFLELVSVVSGSSNGGNKVTDKLKMQIKFARQLGVHVSPTVFWDGIREDSVSSSWDLDQWKEFLAKKL
ncbi:hypothetical protein BZG36_01181 [Bifiguratus adelaidae]|uniref:Thioredoxin-like fold domain-containing protein n=1 Tax=Bifiguratus adelaidae TaxID=1938954 RepID=A0A261Y5Q7_9FUNG|nr:hypothetical protein BZG36_01181 [Bifiguratus adelaidae]